LTTALSDYLVKRVFAVKGGVDWMLGEAIGLE